MVTFQLGTNHTFSIFLNLLSGLSKFLSLKYNAGTNSWYLRRK